MTITTSAPHAATLDALSRVRTLIVEHRDNLVPFTVSITVKGTVRLQFTSADTFDEFTRRASVDMAAAAMHLPTPEVAEGNIYTSSGRGVTVFTGVIPAVKCASCGKPVVR